MKKRFSKKEYKEKIIQYKELSEFSKKYKEIDYIATNKLVKLILEEYVKIAINNPDGVQLPSKMGHLSIQLNSDLETINKKVRAETGYENNYLNLSTDGKVGKIVWNFYPDIKQNKYLKLLCFKPHTSFKNKAVIEIKENHNKFNNARKNNK